VPSSRAATPASISPSCGPPGCQTYRREACQGKRAEQHRHLGADHQLAPVEGVGQHARAKRQQHQRDQAGRADHAERQHAARQLVDLPRHRRPAHLAAGERHKVAEPEQRKVTRLERR